MITLQDSDSGGGGEEESRPDHIPVIFLMFAPADPGVKHAEKCELCTILWFIKQYINGGYIVNVLCIYYI